MYSKKCDHLDKILKFLEKDDLPKQAEDETEKLKSSFPIKEIDHCKPYHKEIYPYDLEGKKWASSEGEPLQADALVFLTD